MAQRGTDRGCLRGPGGRRRPSAGRGEEGRLRRDAGPDARGDLGLHDRGRGGATAGVKLRVAPLGESLLVQPESTPQVPQRWRSTVTAVLGLTLQLPGTASSAAAPAATSMTASPSRSLTCAPAPAASGLMREYYGLTPLSEAGKGGRACASPSCRSIGPHRWRWSRSGAATASRSPWWTPSGRCDRGCGLRFRHRGVHPGYRGCIARRAQPGGHHHLPVQPLLHDRLPARGRRRRRAGTGGRPADHLHQHRLLPGPDRCGDGGDL